MICEFQKVNYIGNKELRAKKNASGKFRRTNKVSSLSQCLALGSMAIALACRHMMRRLSRAHCAPINGEATVVSSRFILYAKQQNQQQ